MNEEKTHTKLNLFLNWTKKQQQQLNQRFFRKHKQEPWSKWSNTRNERKVQTQFMISKVVTFTLQEKNIKFDLVIMIIKLQTSLFVCLSSLSLLLFKCTAALIFFLLIFENVCTCFRMKRRRNKKSGTTNLFLLYCHLYRFPQEMEFHCGSVSYERARASKRTNDMLICSNVHFNWFRQNGIDEWVKHKNPSMQLGCVCVCARVHVYFFKLKFTFCESFGGCIII